MAEQGIAKWHSSWQLWLQHGVSMVQVFVVSGDLHESCTAGRAISRYSFCLKLKFDAILNTSSGRMSWCARLLPERLLIVSVMCIANESHA